MRSRNTEEGPNWGAIFGGIAAIGLAAIGAVAAVSVAGEAMSIAEPTRPSQICFTQPSITSRVNFQGEQSRLKNLVHSVLGGERVKPIRIVYHNGEWKSIDNHRLFAFQLLEKETKKAPSYPWFEVVEETQEFHNKNQTKDGREVLVAKTFSWNFRSSDLREIYEELEHLT